MLALILGDTNLPKILIKLLKKKKIKFIILDLTKKKNLQKF